MPPAKRTDSQPVTPWGSAETLDGLEIRDKAELLGRIFLIEKIWFETGSRGVEYVYVQAQFENGEQFTFNDSSSGVRAQIEAYLKSKDRNPEEGQVVPMNLVIPRGLRYSEYEVTDDRNRRKMAKTYYLTTSGKKAE